MKFKLTDETLNMPGVFSIIPHEIAINNINIVEAHTLRSDYTLYVGRKDGAKVHTLMENLAETIKR